MSASLNLVVPGAPRPSRDAAQGGRAAELRSMERMHLVSLSTVRQSPVLQGSLASSLRRMVGEMAENSGYQVLSVLFTPSRMDVLLELTGLHRPQSVTRELKGLTSLRLFQQFPALRVKLKSHHLWE